MSLASAEVAEIRRVAIANVRRLMSKAWNSQHVNWVVMKEVFGMGSTRAMETCRWIGIDPEGYTV